MKFKILALILLGCTLNPTSSPAEQVAHQATDQKELTPDEIINFDTKFTGTYRPSRFGGDPYTCVITIKAEWPNLLVRVTSNGKYNCNDEGTSWAFNCKTYQSNYRCVYSKLVDLSEFPQVKPNFKPKDRVGLIFDLPVKGGTIFVGHVYYNGTVKSGTLDWIGSSTNIR